VVIGIDPHDGYSLGISPPGFKADIILSTHDHFDHNAINVIAKPNAKVYRMFADEDEVNGIKIKGLPTYHDDVGGALRGRNIMYSIIVDGLKVVHAGDLGCIPEESIIEEIKGCDILMVPVGGTYTLGPKDSAKLVELIVPKITIPMHYRYDGLKLSIKEVNDFLKYVKFPIEPVKGNTLEITKEKIPLQPKVIVLEPPR